MPERCPLEKKIIALAFEKNIDLDEATYKVLSEIMWSLSNHRVQGLYERLFKGMEAQGEKS